MTSDRPRYYTTERACSCPDWKFRGRSRPCKHVKALRKAGELVESQREFNNHAKERIYLWTSR